MASYSLVGTRGSLAISAVSAAVTPTWGSGEARTVGNLLILVVNGYGSTTRPTTPSGWNLAPHTNTSPGGVCSTTIFWRVATGGDAAPTVAALSGTTWYAELMEFTSGTSSHAADQGGTANGATSPLSINTGGVDAQTGDLIISIAAGSYSALTNISVNAHSFNNGATANELKNTGANQDILYNFSWGVTTGHSSNDTDSFSFTTTNEKSTCVLLISFKPLTQATTDSATISSKTTPTSTTETAQFVESNVISSKSTITNITETRQSVESQTIKSVTTPSSADFAKDIESNTITSKSSVIGSESQRGDLNTCSSKTTVSTSDITQFVDSYTITSKTKLSYVEVIPADSKLIASKSSITSTDLLAAIERNTCTSKTTPINTDTSQYVDYGTVATVASHTSLENIFGLDQFTCLSRTTPISTDLVRLVDSPTCASTSNLVNLLDYANYVESSIIRSTTLVSSSESFTYTDSFELTTKTVITSADVATFVESARISSTTTPITATEVFGHIDQNTIPTTTQLLYTDTYTKPADIALITSTTTLVHVAEIQYIVELSGFAFKHYVGETDSHYTADITSHYASEADNHYEAQAVKNYVAR